MRKRSRRDGKNTWKNCTKNIVMNWIATMVCLVTQSQTFWSVKSSEPSLGSTVANKASRCNGIPVELFKTLKDDAIKVSNSLHQQIWKTPQWPQDWKKGQSSSQFPRRVVLKNVLTIKQLHSSPMPVRSCLKL